MYSTKALLLIFTFAAVSSVVAAQTDTSKKSMTPSGYPATNPPVTKNLPIGDLSPSVGNVKPVTTPTLVTPQNPPYPNINPTQPNSNGGNPMKNPSTPTVTPQ